MAKTKLEKEDLAKLKEKSKGFVGEFKEFLLRGNVMDMAIGIIIGGAFTGIVTALTDDFINPLINGIGGAEVAGKIKIYGGQSLNYGHFITACINFVIMAFVLFMLLKSFNKIATIGQKEKAAEEETKKSDEVLLLEEIRDELKKKNK